MSSVNGLLTTYGSLAQVELNYYFTASALGSSGASSSSSYVFLGKPDAFDNDTFPPTPTQDQATIKDVFKHMYAAKLLTTSNLAAVVPRIDWTSGEVYQPYADYKNIFQYDTNGQISYPFYVRNSYDQIFKCLSNNNGGRSTVQPVILPGNTDISKVIGNMVTLADGYQWIYVTTIDKGLKQKFFDANWMPVAIGLNTPNTLVPAGFGTLDAIVVTNSGNNYTNGIQTTTVTITGDGTGASAYANVTSNVVNNIVVTNAGNNYTYATITVTPSAGHTGSGATANAVISPIGGHGYDPVSELGCRHIMMSVEFDGDEGGKIPTSNVQFRQVGLVINPVLTDGTLPTEGVYNTSDVATLSFGTVPFISGETVFQGPTLESSYFSAKVCSFDEKSNVITLINTKGSYSIGESLMGATSGSSRILISYVPTVFNIGSGYMMYYENRQPVTRTTNDNQQIRLVLKF